MTFNISPLYIEANSNDWLCGNLGDQCQRAWISLAGWRLCLHQKTLRSAEEEKACLCPGLQWVRAHFCVKITFRSPQHIL